MSHVTIVVIDYFKKMYKIKLTNKKVLFITLKFLGQIVLLEKYELYVMLVNIKYVKYYLKKIIHITLFR